jgi:hypothetical protein
MILIQGDLCTTKQKRRDVNLVARCLRLILRGRLLLILKVNFAARRHDETKSHREIIGSTSITATSRKLHV